MDGRRIARVKVERRGRGEGPTRPKDGSRDSR